MTKYALFALVLFVSSLQAADWPQFRGPGGSGSAPDKDLPTQWSADINLRWKVALPGRGLSNPVIADGRIFVTANSGWQQKKLHVLCFEESTGKKLWERQFWATGSTLCHPKTSMAAPTPVTDGKHIFALFATQDLVALDRDGNLLWYRSLTGDYPTLGNNVGMASSPVLWKDVVIVDVMNVGESFAAGIDMHSGENLWRVDRPRDINWTTPLLVDTANGPQVVFQNSGGLSAYHPQTGKPLWKHQASLSSVASPAYSDGKIYAPGGKLLALTPGTADKKTGVHWQSNKLASSYATPLIHQGKIYALNSKGVLRCADAKTGEPLWDLRLDGDFATSPVAANGKLYLTNEEGTTYVVDTEMKEVIHTNHISDKILATPALANGALYLRSDGWLYCIGSKK
jgi:outer membrane protein assembly factor BamB